MAILLKRRLEDFVALYRAISHKLAMEIDCAGNIIGNIMEKPVRAVVLYPSQLGIVQAARDRLDSSLYGIRQLLHADLLETMKLQ